MKAKAAEPTALPSELGERVMQTFDGSHRRVDDGGCRRVRRAPTLDEVERPGDEP